MMNKKALFFDFRVYFVVLMTMRSPMTMTIGSLIPLSIGSWWVVVELLLHHPHHS